jgi:D-methionine transport system ATP-binding protein
LRLLNRLQDRSGGELAFQGQAIEKTPVLQLRQQVTLVGQEPRLMGMTVAEALRYPLRLRGMEASAVAERIQAWMEWLHIPQDWLDRTELELSVGQRQRVAVARGALIQPKALLLDEPTASQDGGHGERLVAALTRLAKEHGMVLLMANHQLQWVEQFCDRVLFLQEGQIVGNWLINQVDWPQLRQAIAMAEAHEQAEWG